MSVIINLKICDNVKECGVPNKCSVKAIFWDEKKGSLQVDPKKCIKCFACVDECPAGAIMVANDDEEYENLIEMVKQDPRTIDDLFVDRFGAVTVKLSNEKSFSELIELMKKNTGVNAFEVVNGDSPSCLISAIPYSEIFYKQNIKLYKAMISNSDVEEVKKILNIRQLPVLIIIRDDKSIFVNDGFVGNNDEENKKKFINKVNNVLNNL